MVCEHTLPDISRIAKSEAVKDLGMLSLPHWMGFKLKEFPVKKQKETSLSLTESWLPWRKNCTMLAAMFIQGPLTTLAHFQNSIINE